MRTIEHWIGGTTTASTSRRSAPIWNPATGEQTRQVVLGSAHDVDDAVRNGLEAFQDRSQASLSKGSKVLFAFRELVNSHEGVSFYTRGKVVTARWPDIDHRSDASFRCPTSKGPRTSLPNRSHQQCPNTPCSQAHAPVTRDRKAS